jgi:Patatin-like phospholipase
MAVKAVASHVLEETVFLFGSGTRTSHRSCAVMSQTDGLHEVKQQPFLEVFQAELEELRERRKRCDPEGLSELPGEGAAPPAPSVELGLVGLALSGGGIRSASFSLGVVQELARRNLLKYVDYLSTVSGGGYLGSCLSSLLAGTGASALSPEHFPLRKEAGQPEPPVLRHLRNGSNYLRLPGVLSAMGLPAIVLRGFILSILSLLPMIYAAVLLTGFYYEVLVPILLRKEIYPGLTWTGTAVICSAGVFIAIALLFPFVSVLLRPWMDWHNRSRYQKALATVLLLSVVLLVLWPLLYMVHVAAYMTPGQWIGNAVRPLTGSFGSETSHPLLLGGLGVMLALLACLPLGRKALRVLGMTLATLAGPCVLFATYLLLCAWQVDPPRCFERSNGGEVTQASAPTSDPTCAKTSRYLRPLPLINTRLDAEPAPKSSNSFLEGVDKTFMDEVLKAPPDQTFYIPLANGEGFYGIWKGKELLVWGDMFDRDGLLLLLLVVLSGVLQLSLLNINHTSPHGFYRDQLSRVFLVKEGKTREDEPEPNDALKLSMLGGGEGSCAPYHLLNAAINLGSDPDPSHRGRKGGFFLFSKRYVGSEQTGWCPTKEMEKCEPHLDLGTAMAISAAAASPNMGSFTSRTFSFLLMLLNIRLGYWLPNPRAVLARASAKGLRRPFSGPGPSYLWKEGLGTFDTRGRYVNVSDGGHIENLGVYELLRRRCKLIIAVDGEADPHMRFGSLATLLRFARIDLGISIEIDSRKVRGEKGTSAAHWMVGTIDYGGGARGTLLYLKSSFTGDESPYLQAYREEHPDFPHESTADQFFSETQLEVYRALGEHITGEAGFLEELRQALGRTDPGEQREVAARQVFSSAA